MCEEWGWQVGEPRLSPTATGMASTDKRRPTDEIGVAFSQSPEWSLGFNGVTIGDTHGVGPSARLIMSYSSNSFSSSSTFMHKWKGTRRWFCADGLMFLSMYKRTWKFLSFLTPLNSSGCCFESVSIVMASRDPVVLMLILINPRSNVVFKLSNEPPSPGTTKVSASVIFRLHSTMPRNVQMTFIGNFDP